MMYRDTAIPIECKHCGREFIPNKPNQIYCSKSCRLAKYVKDEPYPEVVCPLCNSTFTQTHARQIYCSKECYNKHRSALYFPSRIRPVIMEAIMERDNYQCQDCGAAIPKDRDKSNHGYLHHIVPLLQGGKDEPANIILLCSSCHSKRHKRIQEASERSNRVSKNVNE